MLITPLNILINIIVDTYFQESRCLIIIKSSNDSFVYSNKMPFVIVDEDSIKKWDVIFNFFGCQGFIVSSKSPITVFEEFEKEMKLHMERFNKRRYLFVPANLLSDMDEILSARSLKFVADLLIIKEDVSNRHIIGSKALRIDEEKTYRLFTHQYVGERASANKMIELDKWFSKNGSFLLGANLYPDKLSNQLGRPIKFVTFSYKPYSIPKEVVLDSDGVEITLAFTYAKWHNATPELIVDNEGTWGYVFENWTGGGVIGNIAQDSADIGFGGMYPWDHEFGYLDFSKSHIRSSVRILVPAPTLASGWSTPTLSFSTIVWVMVIGSFFAMALSAFSIHIMMTLMTKNPTRYETIKSYAFRVFGLSIYSIGGSFLQQPIPWYFIPKNILGRGLFGLILLVTLLLTTSYSSGLASGMTIPRYTGQIRTLQEMADSGMYWGATSDAWIHSIFNVTEEKIVIIRDRFIIANDSELQRRAKERFGYGIERITEDYYAIENYVTMDIVENSRVNTEDLYWANVIMMLRKGSILLPSFDKYLMNVYEAGLMTHWEVSVTARDSSSKIVKAIKGPQYHEEIRTVVLSWTHVEGAFGIWSIGILLSLVIFLLELVVNSKHEHKSKNNQDGFAWSSNT